MSAYSAYEKRVAPLRGQSSLWLLVSGLILFFVAVFGLQILLSAILSLFQICSQNACGLTQLDCAHVEAGAAQRNLCVLFSFIVPSLSLWAVLKWYHKQAILQVTEPLELVSADFYRVLLAALVLIGLVLIVSFFGSSRPLSNIAFLSWLRWLPFALIAIFIQVSFEELFFRGYLQSQLAIRFSNPLIWIVAPSALFGVLHYAPSVYGDNALLIALWATLFGIAAADLTARTGNLGAAIALHFANNISGILIVGLKGQFDGLALLVTPFSGADIQSVRDAMWVEFPSLLCLWLAARIAIRR